MTFFKKIALLTAFFFISLLADAQSLAFFEAMQAFTNKDYEQATELFKNIVSSENDNDAAYYYLGLIAEDELEKESYLKQAISLDSTNYWYQYALAGHYLQSGNIDKATSLYESLINQYPKKSSLYYDVIGIYMAGDDAQKALDALDVIETRTGKSETLALARIELMFKQKEPQKAYDFLLDYYKDFRSPRLATLIGDYYMGLYQEDEALNYYQQALEMDPTFVEAAYKASHIYRSKGQYDNYFNYLRSFIKSNQIAPQGKAAYMEDLLKSGQFAQLFAPQIDSLMGEMYATHPTDSLVTGLTAAYYYQSGQVDKALDVYKRLMADYPDDAAAAFNYCLILYYAEDWYNVISYSTVAIQQYSNPIDFLQMRGIAFWQVNEYDSSMQDYRTMLAMAPRDSAIALSCYTAIGDLYHLDGNKKEAYKNYDKALKINPNYAPVLNNYAYYLTDAYTKPLSKPDATLRKAMKMSLITIQQEPDNATYVDTYAWLLHLCGRDVEAKAMFKHAMLYGGKDSATILEHYAIVLQTLGEDALANIYFKQAKALDPEE